MRTYTQYVAGCVLCALAALFFLAFSVAGLFSEVSPKILLWLLIAVPCAFLAVCNGRAAHRCKARRLAVRANELGGRGVEGADRAAGRLACGPRFEKRRSVDPSTLPSPESTIPSGKVYDVASSVYIGFISIVAILVGETSFGILTGAILLLNLLGRAGSE